MVVRHGSRCGRGVTLMRSDYVAAIRAAESGAVTDTLRLQKQ